LVLQHCSSMPIGLKMQSRSKAATTIFLSLQRYFELLFRMYLRGDSSSERLVNTSCE
jgi:hypothetical protein